jgi:hypothetical protein
VRSAENADSFRLRKQSHGVLNFTVRYCPAMASEAPTDATPSLSDAAALALLPPASAASPGAVADAVSPAGRDTTATAGAPDGSARGAAPSHSGAEEGSGSEGAGEEDGDEWEEDGEDEYSEDYGVESDDSEESESAFRAEAKANGEDMEEYDRQIARDKARARDRMRMVEAMFEGYGRAAEAAPAYVFPSDPSVIVRVPPTTTGLPLDVND